MNQPAAYFWNGKEVEVVPIQLGFSEGRKEPYVNKLCVDTFRGTEEPAFRYGLFRDTSGWKYVPLEQFPPEFRAHLLLLGVS